MEAMDWGDIEDFVHFGEVGAHMVDECRHYVLLAPQNLVGTTIMTNLHEMVRQLVSRVMLVCMHPTVCHALRTKGRVDVMSLHACHEL